MYIKPKAVRPASESVELLTSIMVCYPEVGTINFEPDKQVLKFTFILSQVLPDEEIDQFRDKLLASIEAYNNLENRQAAVIGLTAHFCDRLTLLEITRDVETLDYDEIALMIVLLKRAFGKYILAEDYEGLPEEDLLMQEDLIRQTLECLRRGGQNKRLVAFREEGRVLVFNR